MAMLKLTKGRTYTRTGLSCKRGVPFYADQKLAADLLLSGRFVQLKEKTGMNNEGADGPTEPAGIFDSMKVEDLKKYAAENGIDITGLKKKDEILDVIKSAENGEVSGPTEPAEPDTSMESLFEQ